MTLHKPTNLPLLMVLMCMGTFPACAPRLSSGNATTYMVDLKPLWDSTKSYYYFGNYEFIPLRPWRDGRFLDVRFDSTLFNNGTRVLCINGQVMQYGDTVGSPGVQIIVGTVMRRDAQVINNSGMPPVTGDYFGTNIQ